METLGSCFLLKRVSLVAGGLGLADIEDNSSKSVLINLLYFLFVFFGHTTLHGGCDIFNRLISEINFVKSEHTSQDHGIWQGGKFVTSYTFLYISQEEIAKTDWCKGDKTV